MANIDKWKIPFFYATKKTAGVSGEGNGFFWQQDNDIFDDSDRGMVRLGKEFDDVEVINESTGEFEFPFLAEGDYLALEVTTGHHSGNEEHGCEGFEYRIKVSIETTPAKFTYEKEMYHGGATHDDPKTGIWTHPKANYKIIGSGWNGFGIVRYNKPKARPDGGDSVVLETWWNPHPDTDIADWTMLKSAEDRGEGASNWGRGGTGCNGTEHQVGTWSNVQFRFKSGASDFSLHPLIPEFEDGSNIHSIGGADMDFEESEKRGYGKREDMPRDIEMKCLFKIDSNNGKVRFKNISLREIDPGIELVDNPTNPTPSNSPTSLTTVRGVFVYKWDVNQIRSSPCSVIGSAIFYEVLGSDQDDSRKLVNHVDEQQRTRIVEEVTSSIISPFQNKIPEAFKAAIWKHGSPLDDHKVRAKIWNSAGTMVYESPDVLDPSSLPSSSSVDLADPSTWTTFSFSSNSYKMVVGDKIGIDYIGDDPANCIKVAYGKDLVQGSRYSARKVISGVNVWEPEDLRDCCFQIKA